MSYIILVTNPANGRVMAIADNNEADDLKTYSSYDEAEQAASETLAVCRAWDFAIVEAP